MECIMPRICVAGIIVASVAGPAFAAGPQPEPPRQQGQITSQPAQTTAQEKSSPGGRVRTLPDYNIQKE